MRIAVGEQTLEERPCPRCNRPVITVAVGGILAPYELDDDGGLPRPHDCR